MPGALRTTLPAVGHDPGAVNPRSIEAWGARSAKPAAQPQAAERQTSPPPVMPEAPSSAPGHRRLLAYVGNGSEALDIYAAQTVTVGKHRDCDIVCRAFPSPENDSITHGVSRQHARLVVVNGKLLIEDLRSLNGTFLDDRRLALGTQVAVSDGQLLRLGPVLTMEVRLFKGGAALLRRVDEYHGGFPATLIIWREAPIGDPILGLLPPGNDSGARYGTVRSHGEAQELWWYGPQTVPWQRNGRPLTGAQAILPGDRLTLGSTIVEWDAGGKPGLT
jgi:hypothetical protein